MEQTSFAAKGLQSYKIGFQILFLNSNRLMPKLIRAQLTCFVASNPSLAEGYSDRCRNGQVPNAKNVELILVT